MKFVKSFNQISKKDVDIAGGKGANLGEMMRVGIPVPLGFVVLANAFERFLEENDINVEIEAMWDRINIEDMESVEENSEIVRDLIMKGKMPEGLAGEIMEAYDRLNSNIEIRNPKQIQNSKFKITDSTGSFVPRRLRRGPQDDIFYVAVRSSATVEDSKIDSWAGELETYLNTTKENLIENVKKCWASLYTPRALFYRAQRKLIKKKISVAVVIQKMIQSEVSGVCFTVHPVTKNKNQMVIEAVWGLGEILVSGKVTPDTYVIKKNTLNILDKNINSQERMIIKTKRGNRTIIIPKSKKGKQKLSKKQISGLAKLCLKIEKYYKSPQDIEWAIEKNKLYILQTRPITT